MIKSYKKRKIDLTSKVQVYKNLHKDCYSIRQNGLVVGHADKVVLWGCAFKVSKMGVQKIRKEKKKSVIAYVEGNISPCRRPITRVFEQNLENEKISSDFTFNPYKNEEFICTKTQTPLKTAAYCLLDSKRRKVVLW